MEYSNHISVLKTEVLEFFSENLKGHDLFADLTFGAGGHTMAMANLHPEVRIVSFDQDPDALENGKNLISTHNLSKRIKLIDSNFEFFPDYFEENKKTQDYAGGFKGILLDLGVSSHHFDDISRGFSFKGDSSLDMRMNNRIGITAADIVNQYDESDLATIFIEYGEEKFAKRIAAEICNKRKQALITTTSELENIIFHCYPKKMRFGKTNPSTRCFQALRIAVNRELELLTDTIPRLIDPLANNGRLAIISFHSLEDRIVKHSFKDLSRTRNDVKILTKKPIVPSEEELKINHRSRSAKLRILERVLE